MNSVGSLAIAARYQGGALSGLTVGLERPPVARLFLGQEPAAVLRTVPYLYTLCAHAQRAAAQAALAAAGDEAPPPGERAELWSEALHEHLWRLLLDWPPALGLAPAKEAFVAWRAARGHADFAAVTAELVRSVLTGEWSENCRRRLPDSAADNFGPPPLTPGAWLAYWRNESAVEPVTARPASIAAAWEARLTAALQAAQALLAGSPYPLAAAGGDGWGVGQTLTARGVLTHAARLENGRVAAYRVWAPTDCHFAGADGLAALLAGGRWAEREAARRALEQAVLALDPCLPYTVKVDNA